ncbi:MAG: Acetyl-CoA synthetase, partial [Acidobacteria bacterium]|nr:Acetyl-CoA synthetase [Acidobacteriota bacterium]
DELFQTFSETTKRFRFFHAIKEMPHRTLARYCNIDYDREMAIVAELTEDGKRSLTGIVTLVVEFDGRSGEISIVVGDPWQNQGLGSVMFDCIIEIGKDMGLKRIIAEILAENKAMMNIARIRGFEAKLSDEETYMATLKLEENNK